MSTNNEASFEDTCNESYVVLEKDTAMICLILNCIPFTSGVGTMVSACVNKD